MTHLNTFRPHLRTLLTGLVCAATAVLAPACSKDDSGASNGFFDEQGVWLLTQVQLDPETQDSDAEPAANDGFWMRFGKDKKGKLVAATAACGIEGDDSDTAFHVLHTGCADENLADKRVWQCKCYDYSFDDKTMVWSERKAKKAEKEKKKKKKDEDEDLLALNFPYQDDDGSKKDESEKKDESKKKEDDEDGEKKKKDSNEEELTSTTIKKHKSKDDVYIFTGMPNFDNKKLKEDNEDGVFQSNGFTSKHTFSKRTIKKFKGTGCAKVCGIVDADEDEDDEDKKEESDQEANKSDEKDNSKNKESSDDE